MHLHFQNNMRNLLLFITLITSGVLNAQISERVGGNHPSNLVYLYDGEKSQLHKRINPNVILEETKAILTYVDSQISITAPTDIIPLNGLIRDLKRFGIWNKLDLLYVFAGGGNENFKLINLKTPGTFNGVGNGGLTWYSDGVQGNGSNAYINTTFNPNISNPNYTLNNASRGGFVVSYTGTFNFDGVVGVARNDYNGSVMRLNGTAIATVNYDGSLGGLFITRQNSTQVEVTMKNSTATYSISSGSTATAHEQGILRRQAAYGNIRLGLYFMGGYLTYAETQLFRTAYNNYLIALDITPYG